MMADQLREWKKMVGIELEEILILQTHEKRFVEMGKGSIQIPYTETLDQLLVQVVFHEV